MTSRGLVIVLLALLSITGCARHASQPASRLTEAQRDTALARSSLPGASTVGRALDVSGQGTGHAAQVDSLTR
jgi:hypothetical protein